MFKLKKKYLMPGVKLALLGLPIALLVVGGYSYSVVSELKLKIKETGIVRTSVQQHPSTLESDTKVKSYQLKEFLLFTQGGDLLDELVSEQRIQKSGDDYFVNKQILLPQIYENDCSRVRCVQIKTNFSDIPSSIWKALLGTEDFRFLEHRGVDPLAIGRAVLVDIIAMKFVQGGSTLTQQLMKNLFLTNERNLSRKLRELVYALYIENVMSKEQIMTLYLNEVFWGTFQGIYLKGHKAASLAYFHKAPKDLTDYEATILVALLKGPTFYGPSGKIERLRARTRAVYRRLKSLNLVSKLGDEEWSDHEWLVFQEKFKERKQKSYFKNYYLVSQSRETALEPYEKYVFYESVRATNERLRSRISDADIGIKAMVGDKGCRGYDCTEVFSFYSKLEREKRAAIVHERHQVGSLLKPIVYDSLIDLGRSYDEEISTKKLVLQLKSGEWAPKDYSRTKEDTVLLKTALQKSRNIPLIRVASEVGFDKLEDLLVSKIPGLKLPLSEYPAQLLGAVELTLEEVFRLYSDFIQNKCRSIKMAGEKLENTILYYMSVAGETTISGLAKAPLKNAYIFGKTGTTNKGLDNWYFAFDGKQIYVIWYGVESSRDKYDIRISGASTSFMIFQDFIHHRGKQIAEIHCD